MLRIGLALQPPFDFAVMRQHHSALIAENVYYSGHPAAAPEWRRRAAAEYVAQATIPEPIVTERLAGLIYAAAGHEDLRLPRMLLGLFWVVGGLFLYGALKQWSSPASAAVAFAVYSFLPYSFRASISLLPDSLAVLLMCAALYGLARLGAVLTPQRLFWAALPAAGAIVVRPMTAFFLLPSAVALLWQSRRGGSPMRALAIYGLVAILPFLVYFAWRVGADSTYAARVSTTFAPSLFVDAGFYRGWARYVWMAFGPVLFAAALAGALVAPAGPIRAVLRAMWPGYVAYGLVFNLHISTHPYYQTIAVPMVACSAGALAAWLSRLSTRLEAWLPATVAAGLTAAALAQGTFAPPLAASRIADYEAIGAAVEHSPQVIFLSEDWGTPLRYYGGLAGRYWPTRFEIQMYLPLGASGLVNSDAPARWQALSSAVGGARFFVVTDLDELSRQPDLQQLLTERFNLRKRTERYLVYEALQ